MKLTRRQLRRMIAQERNQVLREAAEADGLAEPKQKEGKQKKENKKPQTEMLQLAGSRTGRTIESAGRKVIEAARRIGAVAEDQTGTAREALQKLSEFYEKMGRAAAGLTSLQEGEKMSDALPDLQELSDLQKELSKLEA